MNVSSAASSEFFKNATKPEWRTESRPVDLSDEQPAIFKRYCQWLYTGFIAPGLLAESSSGCLAYMYVLGEKIVDHEFQNAVIQAIISDMDRMNVVPSLRTIKIIYDGTTEESAARRLLVDIAPPEDFEMPSLRDDVVPIQVGCNKTSLLRVHTTVLTKSSELLKNVMKPEWRTDFTKPIDMSDMELTISEAYCGWLYTGKIVHHEKGKRHGFLSELYVLGERLMDIAFQDVIVAAIIRFSIGSNIFPVNDAIQTIYTGTPATSPARRLLVDFWVFNAVPAYDGLENLTKETCPEFVNDLVHELIVKRDRPANFVQRPWLANPESYRMDSGTR
ncbi:unnamed protein product [Alternaria alternata]